MSLKNQIATSDYLPYEEYKRLLERLHKDHEYLFELFATLGFCTACRVSDILNLCWKDIINVPSLTVVEQKTGKTRKIPFNKNIQAKFLDLYNRLGTPEAGNIIFTTNRSKGKPMSCQHINRWLKHFKVRYKLNINNFSTHTFRKTFGRYVYELNNRSPESLMLLNKIFKHANFQTTLRYIGITQDEIDRVFDSIAI